MTGTVTDQRLLAAGAADLDAHLRLLGPLPDLAAEHVVAAAHGAGLTGRGGAGFPVARKLATVAAAGGGVVVANGAEGEPASSKDRVLLSRAPHLVLDGLALTARAVGATSAYLFAPADLIDSTLARAVAQRRDRVSVRAVTAPDTFVAGQESAVVSALNGRAAIPMSTRYPVYERGVGGRPTLVQNAETLAHLALLARHGVDWFRSVGSPEDPGTRLFTVSGAVHRPAVYELAGGVPLLDVITSAGGTTTRIQALLVGGYHGGWVPWSERTAGLPTTRAALAPYDAAPGAGVVVALAADRCGLQAGADIAAYLAGQSAAQCGPCRNGLPTLAELLRRLAYGPDPVRALPEIDRIVGMVDGRGACHHPGGTARLVRSTLRTFAAEARDHLSSRCVAGTRFGSRR